MTKIRPSPDVASQPKTSKASVGSVFSQFSVADADAKTGQSPHSLAIGRLYSDDGRPFQPFAAKIFVEGAVSGKQEGLSFSVEPSGNVVAARFDANMNTYVKLSPSDEKALAKSLKKKSNQANLPNVTFKMELADGFPPGTKEVETNTISLVSKWIALIEKTKK